MSWRGVGFAALVALFLGFGVLGAAGPVHADDPTPTPYYVCLTPPCSGYWWLASDPPTWAPVPTYPPVPTFEPVPTYPPQPTFPPVPTWPPLPTYAPAPTYPPLPSLVPCETPAATGDSCVVTLMGFGGDAASTVTAVGVALTFLVFGVVGLFVFGMLRRG